MLIPLGNNSYLTVTPALAAGFAAYNANLALIKLNQDHNKNASK